MTKGLRIVGIGGEPATGKSSLVRSIIVEAGPSAPLHFGLLRGTYYAARHLFVFGLYEGKTFDGTDRLSMAVQRDAENYVRTLVKRHPDARVLFEGDRLFNAKFLNVCMEAARASSGEHLFLCLEADEAEKGRRHVERGDSQTEKFLRGRATKYRNLVEDPGLGIECVPHMSKAHLANLSARLIGFLAGKDAGAFRGAPAEEKATPVRSSRQRRGRPG